MDSITLQNYRCFGSEEQTARLAPLTLLVGPNSTGKTSFLALIRALWDVAFREVVPNFREEPFDLGSFDEIVYRPARQSKEAPTFDAGFEWGRHYRHDSPAMEFRATLKQMNGFPYPVLRKIVANQAEVAIETSDDGSDVAYFRAGSDQRRHGLPMERKDQRSLFEFRAFVDIPFRWGSDETGEWQIVTDSSDFEPVIRPLLAGRLRSSRPFAGAPTRFRPLRTYDPILQMRDSEGHSTPSYMANLARHSVANWRSLKHQLENYGRASGLFDEIDVRLLGKSDGDPFQVQVRKHGGPKSRRRKGPWRNLIDVGYGVSQALPVLTELLRSDGSNMLLLQQPEVHLHPQAQAALGTLFCEVAAGGRQLVVETHSDYIIDRVRMDVRDRTTGLKPEDVSILYFEPGDSAVKIHSIQIDGAGNVLGAPVSYGNFFMDEVNRSIGLRKG